jgi:streptogramin lyase
MALKNFTQFTPQTLLSATDFMVGYRQLDEIRTDLDSMSLGVSALLIGKGFLPGTSVGRIKRVGFVYTIGSSSNLNAVSGTDDNGLTLSYTPNQIEVYRNGSHLANNLDFTATNSTQVTNLSTLNLGDVVEVVGLSGVGATILLALSSGINSLVQKNYRYSVATGNTIAPAATLISGSDDYNSVLNFNTNSFQVYLNGSHLVRDYDYISYNSGTSFTLVSPVADGDSVDVISLSSVSITSLSSLSAFSGINKILAGDRIAISSSTGNVTVSSQTCISDIPVPSWTNGRQITQFSLLQNYLSAVAASNTSAASNVSIDFASGFSGASQYNGGCLAPNGKIYLAPWNATVGRFIDPQTNTATTFSMPGLDADSDYAGCVCAPNGKIYYIPFSTTRFRVVDPSNNTVTSFNIINGNGSFQAYYAYGFAASNGKVYGVPTSGINNGSSVLIIDPSNNTHTTIGPIGGGNYAGGVQAPNGKLYLCPRNTIGAILDPDNNHAITTFFTPANAVGNSGMIVAPNGRLIVVPPCVAQYTIGFYIDPSANGGTLAVTFAMRSFSPGESDSGFDGAVLAPNGKIYPIPRSSTIGVVLDPDNFSFTTFGSFAGSIAHIGGVVSPNGKIYCFPYNATSPAILSFLNNNNWNLNVCTNPFFNKV